jgi:hypothetical protein
MRTALLVLLALCSFAAMGYAYNMAIAAAASAPAITDPAQLDDPAEHPDKAVDEFLDLKDVSWPLAVLGALVMLAKAIGYLAPNYAWAAWLGQGRRLMIAAGVGAVATAALKVLLVGGTWAAAGIAAAGAVLVLVSPHPPAKLALLAKKRAVVGTLTIVALCVGVSGCASQMHTMTGAFEACGKADLGQIVEDQGVPLLQYVGQLAKENSPDLEAKLVALAAQVGLDAVECAAVAVESVLHPPSSALKASPGVVRIKMWVARQRAKSS